MNLAAFFSDSMILSNTPRFFTHSDMCAHVIVEMLTANRQPQPVQSLPRLSLCGEVGAFPGGQPIPGLGRSSIVFSSFATG